MKKFLLATVALVAIGATVPALAADLAARPRAYTKAPAYVEPIYNWTGFYIGGHIGGAFGGNSGFAGTTGGGNNSSFLGPYAFFGSGAGAPYAGTNGSGVVGAASLTAEIGINGFTSAAANYAYSSPGSPDTATGPVAANTATFTTSTPQTVDLAGNTLTINGFLNDGAPLTIQNSVPATGSLTIGSNSELIIGGTANVAISAAIVNNGSTPSALTDANSGILTLSGSNSYTGATTISAGSLQIGNGGSTGSLSSTSTIADNANLTFNLTSNIAQGTGFSTAAITGTGSLTQAGTGTVTFNAANTFTGPTAINAGIVNYQNATAFGFNSAITVASGATAQVQGAITGGTDILTLAEAAALLKCCTKTLAKEATAGNVPAKRVGARGASIVLL